MSFDYQINAKAVSDLKARGILIEKRADRTIVSFLHTQELTATGADGQGMSMTVARTPGSRINIGELADGRGVWLQAHLAHWKEPKQAKRRTGAGISQEDAQRMIEAAVQAALRAQRAAAPSARPAARMPEQCAADAIEAAVQQAVPATAPERASAAQAPATPEMRLVAKARKRRLNVK